MTVTQFFLKKEKRDALVFHVESQFYSHRHFLCTAETKKREGLLNILFMSGVFAFYQPALHGAVKKLRGGF